MGCYGAEQGEMVVMETKGVQQFEVESKGNRERRQPFLIWKLICLYLQKAVVWLKLLPPLFIQLAFMSYHKGKSMALY